jgi:amidase
LPATAIPLGLDKDGLPLGAQIVGPWLEDHTPIRLAALIEREFGGFTPPPMFKD